MLEGQYFADGIGRPHLPPLAYLPVGGLPTVGEGLQYPAHMRLAPVLVGDPCQAAKLGAREALGLHHDEQGHQGGKNQCDVLRGACSHAATPMAFNCNHSILQTLQPAAALMGVGTCKGG